MDEYIKSLTHDQMFGVWAVGFAFAMLIRIIVYAIFYSYEKRNKVNSNKYKEIFVVAPFGAFIIFYLGIMFTYITPLFFSLLIGAITIVIVNVALNSTINKGIEKLNYMPLYGDKLIKILKASQITMLAILYAVTMVNVFGDNNLPEGVKDIVITPEGNILHINEDGTRIFDITDGYEKTVEISSKEKEDIKKKHAAQQEQKAMEYAKENLPRTYTALVYKYYSLLENYTDLLNDYHILSNSHNDLEETIIELEDELKRERGY